MKTLTCEICNNTNLIKENSFFVCQSCGTKYTIEEAKKMMNNGSVETTNIVKIDTSIELANLYEVARRAKNSNNYENALRYYDMILVKAPSNWEANFYVVFFKAMSCKIAEIQSAAISVSNCILSTLNLVKNGIIDDKEQQDIVNELHMRVSLIAELLYNAAKNHYNNIDIQVKNKFTQEYIYNVSSSTNIMYNFGNYLTAIFGNTYGTISSESWKQGINMHNGYINLLQDKELNKNIITRYIEKVKQHDATYQAPVINTSSGACYIATSIYGSYDCPEVWILRRFRDNRLSKNWYGRLFIKTYYRFSPIFVKKFGKTKWFKIIFSKSLDKFISKLLKSGIEKTQYQDKQ